MGLVQQLDDVEGAVLLSVQASRAATAVDRYLRRLDVGHTDLQAVGLWKGLIDLRLSGAPVQPPRASVNRLTSTGLAFLSHESVPELNDRGRAWFEQLSQWLGRIAQKQPLVDDVDQKSVKDLEEVRDFLAGIGDLMGTEARDLGEPSVPGARWITAASTRF